MSPTASLRLVREVRLVPEGWMVALQLDQVALRALLARTLAEAQESRGAEAQADWLGQEGPPGRQTQDRRMLFPMPILGRVRPRLPPKERVRRKG